MIWLFWIGVPVLLVICVHAIRRHKRSPQKKQTKDAITVDRVVPHGTLQTEPLQTRADYFDVVEKAEGGLVAYRCGHAYVSRFAIRAYGDILRPSEAYWMERENCGDCLLEHFKRSAKRCVRCRRVIIPISDVLFYPVKADVVLRLGTYVRIARDGSRYAMGCSRKDCCEDLNLVTGLWTDYGYQSIYPDGSGNSIVEQASTSKQMIMA